MDPAQEFEAHMLARLKPINDAIDHGDSAVQQFYCGATVFVTGGSGFLGKQLVEKLFRACRLKKMFLILRPKKGKSVKDRLEYMLKDAVFDMVRSKKPRFADKIVPVHGDVAHVRLGLSDKDWTMITSEADIIIHLAATRRFDEPLSVATLTNVRGTRETLEIAKDCSKLRAYVYVSTAYSQATHDRISKEVVEEFYPAPIPPRVMIAMAEKMDANRLKDITPELTKGWPNTYTFTKAIAEEVVRTYAAELPVCVVRPSIVVSSYLEPTPGWLDLSTVMGPTGILVGFALGVLHLFFVDVDKPLALVPVDLVNNTIIAAAWDSLKKRKNRNEILVYNVANKERFIPWKTAGCTIRNELRQLPSSKAVWYCYMIETNNRLLHWLLTWLIHYVPAYILDGVCAILPFRPKEIPPFVTIYTKINKLSYLHRYFLTNSWQFRDDNVRSMIEKMSYFDKTIFNCDMNKVNQLELIKIWTVGVRKYLIKDGLKDSVSGVKKQRIFFIANCVFIGLYVYVLWSIFSIFWSIVKYSIFWYFS